MSDDTPNNEKKKPPVIRRKTTNGGGLPRPKVPGGADMAAREEEGASPPRVNLKKTNSLQATPADDTARISIPSAQGSDVTERIDIAPPSAGEETERIQIASAKATGPVTADSAEHAKRMSQTDRIDISAAKKPSETSRIDIGTSSPAQDTDRIDLVAAKPASETARISVPDAKPQPAADDDEEFTAVTLDPQVIERAKAKRPSTDRIDLAETMPMDVEPAEEPPAAVPVSQEHEELLAASTVPIESLKDKDLMAAETLPIESILGEGASKETREQAATLMNQTMRVELDPDDVGKSATARIDPVPSAADTPGTSRVELPTGATNGEDVLRRAAVGGAAAAAGAAASKAGAPPPPEPAKEESIGIISPPSQSKPGTARIEVEPPTKSATARIEVDASEIPHAPPRPKSIKLKRAEGAAKKPDQSAESVKPVTGIVAKPADDSFGPLVGVAAVATVLVMAVLIYVLAAQTIADALPFPGRM